MAKKKLLFLHENSICKHSYFCVTLNDSIRGCMLKKDQEAENKSLNVTDLQLPSNVKMFNTGASMEKWCQKRPRLKSTKKVDNPPDETSRKENIDLDLDQDLDLDLDWRENGKQAEQDEEDHKINGDEHGTVSSSPRSSLKLHDEFFELDAEAEKLIAQFIQKPSLDDEGRKPKRRRKRYKFSTNSKKKKDAKNKTLKVKKSVRYSGIKAPSPSTLEIIRVDVTSSYCPLTEQEINNNNNKSNSEEEEDGHKRQLDCSKGHGRRFKCSFVLTSSKPELGEETSLEVECKKLVLGCRKSADRSNRIEATN